MLCPHHRHRLRNRIRNHLEPGSAIIRRLRHRRRRIKQEQRIRTRHSTCRGLRLGLRGRSGSRRCRRRRIRFRIKLLQRLRRRQRSHRRGLLSSIRVDHAGTKIRPGPHRILRDRIRGRQRHHPYRLHHILDLGKRVIRRRTCFVDNNEFLAVLYRRRDRHRLILCQRLLRGVHRIIIQTGRNQRRCHRIILDRVGHIGELLPADIAFRRRNSHLHYLHDRPFSRGLRRRPLRLGHRLRRHAIRLVSNIRTRLRQRLGGLRSNAMIPHHRFLRIILVDNISGQRLCPRRRRYFHREITSQALRLIRSRITMNCLNPKHNNDDGNN